MSSNTTPTHSRSKRIFAWSFLVLFVVAVLEISSCAALAIISEQPDTSKSVPHLFDPFRGHKLNPEYQLAELTYGERVHSDDGFRRDDSISVEKEAGVFRIVMLGGSALYGAASNTGHHYPYHPVLRNDETISFYLEEMINERFRSDSIPLTVEVINAGVSGYHTFNELVYLNASLLDYEPDWVINFDGNNDFYGEIPGMNDWSNLFYSSRVLVDLTNERSFFLATHSSVRSLAPYSNFFSLVEKISNKNFQRVTGAKATELSARQNVLWPASVTGHSAGAGEGPDDKRAGAFQYARETYIRSLTQIGRLSELEDFEHVVILQPQVVFEDDEFLNEHDREIKRITQESVHKNWQMMMRVRKLFAEIFQEHDLEFHDLGDIASHNDSGENLYLDYTHLTPRGSEVVAGRILDVLYPGIVESLDVSGSP